MTDRGREELLRYYQEELSYLRTEGAAFAELYPKVAGRLGLTGEGGGDPHAELLLESFAFLTARLRRTLDQQFPEITSSLLEILHPQLLAPVPSMTVARFEPDPTQGKLTTGHRIPSGTPLFAEARDVDAGSSLPPGRAVTLRFRTCYPVELWPVRIAEAALEPTDRYDFLDHRSDVGSVVRIRLECVQGDFQELAVERLRFHLTGELRESSALYEILLSKDHEVALLDPEGEKPVAPPRSGALHPVGFGEAEAVLPYPDRVHPGYRLLQEYFAFPRKYLFFDVDGLEVLDRGEVVDLLILLEDAPGSEVEVDEETFALGCTPVINLFSRTTEPLRIDQERVEYRLIPDVRRERSTEIHSIRSVTVFSEEDAQAEAVEPYYSFDHDTAEKGGGAFWHARRVATGRRDRPGTDMKITFVDLGFDPTRPAQDTLYAHTLCTNRRLAEQLPAGAALQIEESAPHSRIEVLYKPTIQRDPPLGGETRWRLISHLSLNHLSLESGPDALRALREILRLYAPYGEATMERQIHGLRGITSEPAMTRVGAGAWRGFVAGRTVTLELDDQAFAGGSAFLFASVLRYFFGLYAQSNSFTETVVRRTRREGIWKRWPPLAGARELL